MPNPINLPVNSNTERVDFGAYPNNEQVPMQVAGGALAVKAVSPTVYPNGRKMIGQDRKQNFASVKKADGQKIEKPQGKIYKNENVVTVFKQDKKHKRAKQICKWSCRTNDYAVTG